MRSCILAFQIGYNRLEEAIVSGHRQCGLCKDRMPVLLQVACRGGDLKVIEVSHFSDIC